LACYMVVALVSCRNGPCRGCLLIYRSLFYIVGFLWLKLTRDPGCLMPSVWTANVFKICLIVRLRFLTKLPRCKHIFTNCPRQQINLIPGVELILYFITSGMPTPDFSGIRSAPWRKQFVQRSEAMLGSI
jgi:hypothetical protein